MCFLIVVYAQLSPHLKHPSEIGLAYVGRVHYLKREREISIAQLSKCLSASVQGVTNCLGNHVFYDPICYIRNPREQQNTYNFNTWKLACKNTIFLQISNKQDF